MRAVPDRALLPGGAHGEADGVVGGEARGARGAPEAGERVTVVFLSISVFAPSEASFGGAAVIDAC